MYILYINILIYICKNDSVSRTGHEHALRTWQWLQTRLD